MVQGVMRAMGSDGEWQMKLRSLASCCAARLLTDWYLSMARGLGTPGLNHPVCSVFVIAAPIGQDKGGVQK